MAVECHVPGEPPLEKPRTPEWVAWVLVAMWVCLLLVQPPWMPVILFVGTVVVVAVVHCSLRYGVWRALGLIFIVLVVTFFFENYSIMTGKPFGKYHYTGLLGTPMVGQVPIEIAAVIFAQGYSAWIMASVWWDLGDTRLEPGSFYQFAMPITASFILCLWAVCMDPFMSTVGHWWIWEQGGGFFGVPLQNYVGRLVVSVMLFAAFTAFLSWSGPVRPAGCGALFWLLPVASYTLFGVNYVWQYLLYKGNDVVQDAAGVRWRVADIQETRAILSIFTMVFVGIAATLRLFAPARPGVHTVMAE